MNYKILFLAICMVLSNSYGTGVPGGLKEIDVNSPQVSRLTEFILTKLNEGSGENKQTLVEVIKATVQVVAGTSTRITLKLLEGGSEKICEVAVWERPWLNKTEITDVKCDDTRNSRTRRHALIGKGTHDLHLQLFNDFMKKYNKIYNDEKELKRRYHIFRANLKKIAVLTETEQGTAKYGVNEFADLSAKEFKQYLGLKKPEKVEEIQKAEIPKISIPDSFDWRHYNVVTPVKNQGNCGSCWAFSVTGNIEGQWAIKSGNLLSLSEQELIDCDALDNGCGGGYMTNAYKSIKNMGGLETEEEYPYEGQNDKCQFDADETLVKVAGAVNISSNEDDMARWLVKNGPMSVALNANAMQFYRGGVSHPLKLFCNPENIDHAVLITGYGVRHSRILNKIIPYWIVKNSWGTRWGELGYYRIYRGDGTCGINQMVSSAVVES